MQVGGGGGNGVSTPNWGAAAPPAQRSIKGPQGQPGWPLAPYAVATAACSLAPTMVFAIWRGRSRAAKWLVCCNVIRRAFGSSSALRRRSSGVDRS